MTREQLIAKRRELMAEANRISGELRKMKEEPVTKPVIKWTRIGDLEWSDNLGEMTWNEAKQKARELGGRLPERWEMVKVVDEHYDEIRELVKDDHPSSLWSATSYGDNAWYVYLFDGFTNSIGVKNEYQVRLVRDKPEIFPGTQEAFNKIYIARY